MDKLQLLAPSIKSQGDSWLLDIYRMDDLLKNMHNFLISSQENPSYFVLAVVALQEVWGYIRVFAHDDDKRIKGKKSEYDELLKQYYLEAMQIQRDYIDSQHKKIPYELPDNYYFNLILLKNNILQIRQYVGLGSRSERFTSEEDRVQNALL